MGFKSDLRNDFAYVNGIGRFDIEVESNDQVSWALSKYFFLRYILILFENFSLKLVLRTPYF